jgi:hypothetical protein
MEWQAEACATVEKRVEKRTASKTAPHPRLITTDSALLTTFWQAEHDSLELDAAGCTLG